MQQELKASSKEELDKKIDEYLKMYPVAGYGTHRGVIKEPQNCDCPCHKDNKILHFGACCNPDWTVVMYRERRCD